MVKSERFHLFPVFLSTVISGFIFPQQHILPADSSIDFLQTFLNFSVYPFPKFQ